MIGGNLLPEQTTAFGSSRIYSDIPITNAKHFNFYAYSDAISKIILNKENKTPFTIAINGKWGSGKTTLMKTLREKLDKESDKEGSRKVKSVWFDAWKYSETDSMLAALIFEIFEEMGRKKVLDKLRANIEGGKQINLSAGFADLVKILTGGKVDIDKWFENPEYKAKLSFYDVFQEYIKKILLIFVLDEKDGRYTDEKGVLVIFIDDLDRCPPKNITKVLESINLFFNQEGCFFIIGTDISLISNAIDHEYKVEGFSGRDYIKKMIQLQFDLPAIREDDIKTFMKGELKIEENINKYSEMIVAGLERNQREIKRFLNSLNLMRIVAESIKIQQYKEELLIKMSILSFSSDNFIKEVNNNPELMIRMQEISLKEKDEIEKYIETLDEPIKKLCIKFKENDKIRAVLRSGEKYNDDNVKDYIFLISVAPKEPGETVRIKAGPMTVKDIEDKIRKKESLKGSNLTRLYLEGIDLSNVDLSGATIAWTNLSNSNLSGANLSKANLKKASLDKADLSRADLSEANLAEAKLFEANLSEANLTKADLSKTNLSGAILNTADLSEINLHGAKLTGLDLSRASQVNLTGADFSEAKLSGSNLSGSVLSQVNLTGAVLFKANLSGANISQAKLARANFSKANLSKANLSGSDLSQVNFDGADLTEAKLSGVNLHKLKLPQVNLTGADLTGANLSEADLSQSDLTGAICSKTDFTSGKLSHAKLCKADFTEAKFFKAQLDFADFSDAILEGANLSEANLYHADLSKANLNRSNLSEANLSNAILSGANLNRSDLSGSDLSWSLLVETRMEDVIIKVEPKAEGIRLFDEASPDPAKIKEALEKISPDLRRILIRDNTQWSEDSFGWDEIPGNDSVKLIDFLKQHYSTDWVKTEEIEKIDDGKTIRLSSGNNFLLLKLNNEKTKANLEIDDGRTDEFIAKMEKGKPKIYWSEIYSASLHASGSSG